MCVFHNVFAKDFRCWAQIVKHAIVSNGLSHGTVNFGHWLCKRRFDVGNILSKMIRLLMGLATPNKALHSKRLLGVETKEM